MKAVRFDLKEWALEYVLLREGIVFIIGSIYRHKYFYL